MVDGLTQAVRQMVDQSVQQDCIVHAAWTLGLARRLQEISEGGADTAEVQEFWGEDGGRTWRIHLDK